MLSTAVLVVSAVDVAEVAVAVDVAGASDAVATAATLSLARICIFFCGCTRLSQP